MAKNFTLLRSRMSPESQARAQAKAHAMLAERPRNERIIGLQKLIGQD